MLEPSAPDVLGEKLARLREIIAGYGAALVAFSGGVDSALVLAVAAEVLGERAVALTAVSETMARSEIDAAADLARGLGVRHEVVRSHELLRPGFADNPIDRCYHCKAELLDLSGPVAERIGVSPVLLGTNLDDLGDHRPGLVAARERGARQPLVEAGLSKAEVRVLSRRLGLPTWDKPQLACLSSRFPYGTRITKERLEMVDRLEDGLRALGFRQLRVRLHALPDLDGQVGSGGALARVELDAADIERALPLRGAIARAAKDSGFVYAALDLEGFRSGSGNAVITLGKRKPAPPAAATSTPSPAPPAMAAPPATAPPATTMPAAAAPPATTMPAAAAPAPAAQTVAAPQKAPRPRKVVVAALVRGPGGEVLLSQRRADQPMPLLWELPGGKVEPGEAPEAALVREVREELGVGATVLGIDEVVSHQYAEFDLLMLVYRCALDGEPVPREVAAVRLVPLRELTSYDVLPADVPLIQRLAAGVA